MRCMICDEEFVGKQAGKALGRHLRKVHDMSIDEYLVRHLRMSNKCELCGDETKRVGFQFRRFCKKHAREGMKIAGREGGSASAWNKGLTKESDARVANLAQALTGKNNPFYGRRHTEKSLAKMRSSRRVSQSIFEERVASRDNLVVMTEYSDYESRQNQYLEVICLSCSTLQEKTLQAYERGSQCIKCAASISKGESEVGDFIQSLGFEIRRSVRDIISKELDIVIPNQHIAIEYNGLYWHSDATQTPKNYHLDKMLEAKAAGYRLISVFEDDWRDKRDIVKSMLAHALGVSRKRIYARKTSLREITKEESQEFFNKTHISGATPSKFCLGLAYDNKIVAAMSFRTPRVKALRDRGLIEIARFATQQNTSVVGGLSKLLKAGVENAKELSAQGIITYADLNHGVGLGYERVGFDIEHTTGPNYWYTDCCHRYDRFKYRARSGKPEREVAKDANVHRIYGCGSARYVLEF